MAESRAAGQQAQKETEREGERGSEAARRQTERIAEVGREGARQAVAASKAVTEGAARSDSALAECAQELATAWARYAEDVVRHTTEAGQAFLRARNFTEMLEVQADLLRGNMQAFLEHSARIAEATSRIATRPFEALRQARTEQTRR